MKGLRGETEWDAVINDNSVTLTEEEAFRAWCQDHSDMEYDSHQDAYDAFSSWCIAHGFDAEVDDLDHARELWSRKTVGLPPGHSGRFA